ncbi:EF hand [Cooperia oncophora]
MLPTATFIALVATTCALPAYVNRDDISEIEMSLPAVNLDFLRYISDKLNSFFGPSDYTTTDPRGLNFAQFVATDKCSGQAAWRCFTEIDTNNDGFVSPAELAEYDKSSMTRVQHMYDDYLETSFTEADNDNDDYVSYDEGVDYAENVLKVKADENWRRLFTERDMDGDGRLDKEGEHNAQWVN